MEYTLASGNASNYIITMKLSATDWEEMGQKALLQFQKEVKEPGFRDGHVPLDVVKKKVSPQYLEIATIEEAIHKTTKKLIKEHEDKKFIGTIYELDKNQELKPEDGYEFTFKLDVYPEVHVKNDDWKKATVEVIDATAAPEEIDETIMNLRKQYASYDPAEIVNAASVFKVSFKHLNGTDELET
jgi:trigger factor